MRKKLFTEYSQAVDKGCPQPLPANGHTGCLNVDADGMDHDLAGARKLRIFYAKSPASRHETCAKCYLFNSN
jgi:hypothetical protein